MLYIGSDGHAEWTYFGVGSEADDVEGECDSGIDSEGCSSSTIHVGNAVGMDSVEFSREIGVHDTLYEGERGHS